MRGWIGLLAAAALAGCSGGDRGGGSNTGGNTAGGGDSAQNAIGGVGSGPAAKGGGGVQNPGDTSGDNPQGEVSPSGPGGANQSG